jgi:hypothetical protein
MSLKPYIGIEFREAKNRKSRQQDSLAGRKEGTVVVGKG